MRMRMRIFGLLLQLLVLLLELLGCSLALSNSVVERPDGWRLPNTMVRLQAAALTTDSSTTAAATCYYSTLLDGPCWKSLQHKLRTSQASSPTTSSSVVAGEAVGHLRVVTGMLKDGTRVVGMPTTTTKTSASSDSSSQNSSPSKEEGGNNNHGDDKDHTNLVTLSSGDVLVADSVATIPGHVKPDQAAATYAYALTHVHSLLSSVVESVGGSRDVVLLSPPQQVVVLGGNDDAVLAAQALQALGSHVTLVSTQSPHVSKTKLSSSTSTTIQVTNPSMGDLDVGFAEALGTFDAVLDTIGNELGGGGGGRGGAAVMDPDASSAVVRLLREQHDCGTYVTTCTQAHEIMTREGLLWGPGKVKQYHERLKLAAVASPVPILSAPAKIGTTVQAILDAGIVWSAPPKQTDSGNKNNKNNKVEPPFVRTWELSRFMEHTMWPVDNRGTATTRFGFPVPGAQFEMDDDKDDDDEFMISEEAPFYAQRIVSGMTAIGVEDEEDDFLEQQPDEHEHDTDMELSTLLRIQGVQDLQHQIADQKLDCLLFLSAKFCRACKRMQMPYRRMARLNRELFNHEQQDFVFAQAEASGHAGKLLGRALGVDAVPAFIFYKNGQRYGEPLSVTKLPSEKLEKAIEYLKEGKPWDDQILV
ncbi:hypothetical protein ACA910_006964 [Epithemia clementina (nom. ined.)]